MLKFVQTFCRPLCQFLCPHKPPNAVVNFIKFKCLGGGNHVEATLFVLVSLYCGSVKNQPNLNRQEEVQISHCCLLQVWCVTAKEVLPFGWGFFTTTVFTAPGTRRFGAFDKLAGCQEIRLHILNKDKPWQIMAVCERRAKLFNEKH